MPKGPQACLLYLSETPLVCVEEATRFTEIALSMGVTDASGTATNALPKVFVGFKVSLLKVLDLTKPELLSILGISDDEITGADWEDDQRHDREALTQIIGRIAKESGFEALRANSARCEGKNLVIFCENIQPESVEVVGLQQLYAGAALERVPDNIKGITQRMSLIHRNRKNIGLREEFLELSHEYRERIKASLVINHSDHVIDGCLRIVG